MLACSLLWQVKERLVKWSEACKSAAGQAFMTKLRSANPEELLALQEKSKISTRRTRFGVKNAALFLRDANDRDAATIMDCEF